jgi:branched-chain amino acid transport system permease protein
MLFVVAWFVWRLKKTKLGRGMQAVRDNELAASVVGVDAYATKVVAFTLSALLGGLGGALFAGGFAYVSPDQFSFAESVVFLTMVLVGGAAAPTGAVLGTGLLILLPEWLRFLKVIYLAVYGAAVILIMVFMPDGIWGYAISLWHQLRPKRPFDPALIAALALAGETTRENGSIILSVDGLSKHFGGLKAVDDISLTIRRNTVHALIGPNGSGKTTLLNVLNGIERPNGGTITFDGADVTRLPPHRRAGHGLGRTFQNIRLFGSMSVLDNVMVGAERPHHGSRPAGSNATRLRRSISSALRRALEPASVALATGISALWKSPARLPVARSCCSSTSRGPASTMWRRTNSYACSSASKDTV